MLGGCAITPQPSRLTLEEFYHRPTDRASTLEEQAMWAMADLIMLTVRRLEGR